MISINYSTVVVLVWR